MKNIFLFVCLGFAVGFVVSSQYHIEKKQDVVSYTVRDTLIYKNVDDLRIQARNGNMQAYIYLKNIFLRQVILKKYYIMPWLWLINITNMLLVVMFANQYVAYLKSIILGSMIPRHKILYRIIKIYQIVFC